MEFAARVKSERATFHTVPKIQPLPESLTCNRSPSRRRALSMEFAASVRSELTTVNAVKPVAESSTLADVS